MGGALGSGGGGLRAGRGWRDGVGCAVCSCGVGASAHRGGYVLSLGFGAAVVDGIELGDIGDGEGLTAS